MTDKTKTRLSAVVALAGIFVASTSIFISIENKKNIEIRRELNIEIEELRNKNEKLLEENRSLLEENRNLRKLLEDLRSEKKSQDESSLDFQIGSQNQYHLNKNLRYELLYSMNLLQVQDSNLTPRRTEDSNIPTSSVELPSPIITGIYTLLGAILLISACVTLFAGKEERKDTALEITKTLITFFIGAATGGL